MNIRCLVFGWLFLAVACGGEDSVLAVDEEVDVSVVVEVRGDARMVRASGWMNDAARESGRATPPAARRSS